MTFVPETGLPETIFRERYAIHPEENWDEASRRLSRYVAAAEPDNSRQGIEELFYEEIVSNKFMPGGRIWYGAGRPRSHLLNCFSANMPGDSREGWGKLVSDVIIISGTGGGVGINFSSIRPRGSQIFGSGGIATGAVSLMQMINAVGDVLVTGGARRIALMLALNITHPDMPEFLDKKLDKNELRNANVSVILDKRMPVSKFSKLVREGKSFDLMWKNTSHGKVNARDLWERLVHNAWKSGEPGILNLDLANKENNVAWLKPVITTNPCLPAWTNVLTLNGIAQLGSVNIGDEIWSETGWTTITNKWSTGVKKVYRYTTTAGVFYGTSNHKILSEGKKVEAQSAESIDVLRGQIAASEGFDSLAVMDGLVLGDGSVHKASNGLVYLCVGKKDSDYFEDPILRDQFIRFRPGIKSYAWEVQTSLKAADLPKTYLRKIPDRYVYGDITTKRSFLRGLFSANGSIADGRVQLKASSLDVVEAAQLMLSSIGIRSYYTHNKSHIVEFVNGDYNCKDSYDLNIVADREVFRNLVGFIQKYNNEKLDTICDIPHKKEKTSYQIIDVQEISEEEVFDITVDNSTHTFWNNGLNISNCGEISLTEYECCCLGSIVLPRFVTEEGQLDYEALKKTIHTGIRFLDDVLSVNQFPLDVIRENSQGLRRVGLGIMGLHSVLIKLGYRYGSDSALKLIDDLMHYIKVEAYQASVDLAREKGPFPFFSNEFLDSGFVRRALPHQIQRNIGKYGIRNCAVLTVAPTGTTSMVANVSAGLEPIFAPAYWRRYRKSDGNGGTYAAEELVVDPLWSQVEDVRLLQGAYDITPTQHFEVQRVIQKHIDNSVSKTINLPENYDPSELSALWLDYLPFIKGTTLYREGSREGEPLKAIPIEDAIQLVAQKDALTGTIAESSILDCPGGVCDISHRPENV